MLFPKLVENILAIPINPKNTIIISNVSIVSGYLVDVSEIAVKYGGGGHAKAAGVTMKGTEEEIRDLILADIASVLENV